MNITFYLFFFLLIFICLMIEARNKKIAIKNRIKQKKKRGKLEMVEFAKKFIGKQCFIYTLSETFKCVIKEVSDNAILLETKKSTDVVNLDYVLRISEINR